MEEFQKLAIEANKSFQIADHLAYVTYPFVKDTRLIANITENLYNALINAMNSILHYDKLYKRIFSLPDNFELRFNLFKTRSAPRYNLDKLNLSIIRDLKMIVDARKRSSMEFTRKNQYYIAYNNFSMQSISLEKIKKYLSETRLLIEKVNEITSQYDRRI